MAALNAALPVEFARGRVGLIPHITPLTNEPTLQIWNLPMHTVARRLALIERLRHVELRDTKRLIVAEAPALPQALNPIVNQVDVDISSPAHNFIRLIYLYPVYNSDHRSAGGECGRVS